MLYEVIAGVYSKNKVIYWAESVGGPKYQETTGRPIGAGLYYNAIGVFKDQEALDAYPHFDGARPGDIIFEDYNDDGLIDAVITSYSIHYTKLYEKL